MGKYKIIYADPPWGFSNKKTGGNMKSGALNHYPTMTVKQLCEMDVKSLADDDCILFMWWVASMPEEALQLVKSWGFTLKTMTGFTWVKTSESKARSKIADMAVKIIKHLFENNEHYNQKIGEFILSAIKRARFKHHFGMGFYTRAGSENCLIAVRGKPKIWNHNIRSVHEAPVQAHSQKPDLFYGEILGLAGGEKRVELFARQKVDGWDSWGNEIESDIKIRNNNVRNKTANQRN